MRLAGAGADGPDFWTRSQTEKREKEAADAAKLPHHTGWRNLDSGIGLLKKSGGGRKKKFSSFSLFFPHVATGERRLWEKKGTAAAEKLGGNRIAKMFSQRSRRGAVGKKKTSRKTSRKILPSSITLADHLPLKYFASARLPTTKSDAFSTLSLSRPIRI